MSARQTLARALLPIFGAIALCFGTQSAHAGDEDEAGFFERSKEKVRSIANDGNWDLYLSGYAHHDRDTYDRKRLRKLNEKAWGGGFGKTLRNERGNDESLYLMAIQDSHQRVQVMAGYAHQWIFPLGGTGLEAGAGLTALLMHRKDWFGGAPFPAVLPVASFGTQDIRLMTTFVPRLSTRRGKGDVLLVFLKAEF